jgi:hypothetical protein
VQTPTVHSVVGTVSWIPFLYRWDGGAWQVYGYGQWYSMRTERHVNGYSTWQDAYGRSMSGQRISVAPGYYLIGNHIADSSNNVGAFSPVNGWSNSYVCQA